MKNTTTQKLTIAAATAASALVLAVPAFGATRPDDRTGIRGPGETAAPTQVVAPGISERPDNRAGTLGVGSDSTDAAIAVATNGFDWADAGIGAGAGAGALMVLAFALVVAMPRRRHSRVTA